MGKVRRRKQAVKNIEKKGRQRDFKVSSRLEIIAEGHRLISLPIQREIPRCGCTKFDVKINRRRMCWHMTLTRRRKRHCTNKSRSDSEKMF